MTVADDLTWVGQALADADPFYREAHSRVGAEIARLERVADNLVLAADYQQEKREAAEAEAARLRDAIEWAIAEPNLGVLIRDKQQYEWWVQQIRRRALLAEDGAA